MYLPNRFTSGGTPSWRTLLVCAVLAASVLPPLLSSDEPALCAVTESGRRVLLYDDQRWEYDAPDIRELYWGMTKEQVKAAEPVRLIEDENTMLAFQVEAYSMVGMMFLEFDQGGLDMVGYLFVEHHSDYDQYIRDYESLTAELTREYGEPDNHTEIWRNDAADIPERGLGEAFIEGDVELRTEWYTDRGNTACGLTNEEHLFGLLVGFEAPPR